MILEKNTNDMFKPGDKVVILMNNEGLPGGRIYEAHIGKTYTLKVFREYFDKDEEDNLGYWCMKEVQRVWNCRAFKKVEDGQAAAPVVEKPKEIDFGKLLLDDLRKEARRLRVPYKGVAKAALLNAVVEASKGLPGPVPAVKEAPPPKEEEPWKKWGLQFMEKYNKQQYNTITGYRTIRADGKEVVSTYYNEDSDLHAPCHASLGRKKAWDYFYQAPHKNWLNRPGYKEYVEYWLNDSPLSHAVLTKTWEDALKYGVVVDSKQFTVNQHALFGIGLREGNEFHHPAEMFGKLKAEHVHPRIAWFLASNYWVNGEGVLIPKYWTGAHQVHNSNYDWENFVAFLKEGKLYANPGPTVDQLKQEQHYLVSAALGKPMGDLSIAKKLSSLERRYKKTFNGLLLIAGHLTQEIFG